MTRTRILPRRAISSIASLLVVSAISLVVVPAHAQSAADSATAQALFERGKRLSSAGKYAEAISAFEESQRIEPRGGTLLNLAVCYEKAGRLASAWTTFLDAAARAKAENKAEREQLARERAAALVKKLSKLEIHAPFADATPGLEIKRDDVTVGKAQLALPLPVDAGTHSVSASAPGRKSWQEQVNVPAGAKTATVRVPELAALSVDPPAVAPAGSAATESSDSNEARESSPVATPSADRPSRLTTGVIVAGATTAALAVGTVVTGLLYSSSANDFRKANDDLDPDRHELRREAKTLGVVNLALLGGTIVAAGVTVYLVARTPSSEPSASARVELRGQVGPCFSGLTLSGQM